MPVFVHSTAIVEDGAIIGEGTKVWHWAHVRAGARLGEDCILGKGVYVDAGAQVGSRVKLQNNVNVYNGVTIEDEVFVGPNATFTNDLHPRAVGPWEAVPTVIRRGASIGAGAVVVCGTEIGEYAMVAAGAVVTRSVPAHALVAGVPARVVGRVCRCGGRAPLEGPPVCSECGLQQR